MTKTKKKPSKSAAIREFLAGRPDAGNADVAEKFKVSVSLVSKIRAEQSGDTQLRGRLKKQVEPEAPVLEVLALSVEDRTEQVVRIPIGKPCRIEFFDSDGDAEFSLLVRENGTVMKVEETAIA